MGYKLNIKENVTFLWKHMGRFKLNFVNFYFGMLIQTVITIISPVLLGFIINVVVYYRKIDSFLVLCGIYAFMIIFQCFNYFLIYNNHHYLNSMYVLKIRNELFERIVHGNSEDLVNLNIGEATAIIDEYTDDCLHFIIRNFIHFANNLIVLIWCIYFAKGKGVTFG